MVILIKSKGVAQGYRILVLCKNTENQLKLIEMDNFYICGLNKRNLPNFICKKKTHQKNCEVIVKNAMINMY